MLINDVRADVKKLCIMEDKPQTEVAKEIGVTKQAITQATKGMIVNRMFLEITEALGYDVEIIYKKRK